jgi:glycosyltransferase involved in cell wall biosynthesis
MKILYVNACYYPVYGGVEEYLKNVAERMALRHDVTVFAGDATGRLPAIEKINRVTVKRFKSYAPGNSIHLSLGMIAELKKSHYDIVHAFNYHALPSYFARYAHAKRFILTPCYHGHGHNVLMDVLLKAYKPLGGRVIRDADTVTANSRYERGLLVKDFHRTVIEVVPCGLNLSEFAQRVKNRLLVLSVGRLEEYKGMQHIISAMPYLPDYQLKIVGKGNYKQQLVALTEKLGLNNRVAFLQDLPRLELLDLYAKAGIFVLLSQIESYAITVSEALASHTVCIVNEATALAEWVDNINCFGVNYPVNSELVANLIKRHSGRAVNRPDILDWDKVVDKLEGVYVREGFNISSTLV